MAYTITCHHHVTGRQSRHRQEWESWDEAAQEIRGFVERLTRQSDPSLESPDAIHFLKVAADAVTTGVAELPGIVTYRVVDVADAPLADLPQAEGPDWDAIGRLARKTQKLGIELIHLSAVAPGEQTPEAFRNAQALVTQLVELCVVLDQLTRDPETDFGE